MCILCHIFPLRVFSFSREGIDALEWDKLLQKLRDLEAVSSVIF